VGKAELPAALTHLGLIPIDRSKKANSGWLKALLRVSEHTLTEEKTPVVIFGEGAIHPEDHKVHEIQPGLLAVSKNAEIVPVGICGAAGLLSEFGPLNVARTATRKHKISVAIGEAISLDDDTLLEKGYELPSRSGDKKDFKSLLVQVLIQEQYNRALESLRERD